MLTRNICVGGRDEASNLASLQALGITHVLNVAQQLPNFHDRHFTYLKIDMLDSAETSLQAAIPIACAFLNRVEVLDGRVLVHCIAGVSRSVSLLLAHFMLRHRISLR
jgi:protein-tyrosine phosphatase